MKINHKHQEPKKKTFTHNYNDNKNGFILLQFSSSILRLVCRFRFLLNGHNGPWIKYQAFKSGSSSSSG